MTKDTSPTVVVESHPERSPHTLPELGCSPFLASSISRIMNKYEAHYYAQIIFKIKQKLSDKNDLRCQILSQFTLQHLACTLCYQ